MQYNITKSATTMMKEKDEENKKKKKKKKRKQTNKVVVSFVSVHHSDDDDFTLDAHAKELSILRQRCKTFTTQKNNNKHVFSLVEIAARVALESQCRVYKDDPILLDVLSRVCDWCISPRQTS